MRVQLVQDGPINADEFWECGRKLELVNGVPADGILDGGTVLPGFQVQAAERA